MDRNQRRGVAQKQMYVGSEHREKTHIPHRRWDLLPVIRNHVYHLRFAGSYSLKSVLPALVPELSYEGMAVADGVDAGLAWESGTGHKSGAA